MDVVASNIQHEHLGPVVPVDDEDHRFRVQQQLQQQQRVTLQVPGGDGGRRASSGPVSPVLGGSEHKLIGSSDEHHILTTPGGQRAAQLAAMSPKPKFKNLMNEYVGACFEENCNIGE